MGANLVSGGGATFRVWAPRATEVYLNGVFGGVALSGQLTTSSSLKTPTAIGAAFSTAPVTAAISSTSHRNGLSSERRFVANLDSGIETIHVQMDNGALHNTVCANANRAEIGSPFTVRDQFQWGRF
jgi:hypothetical protein